MLFLACADIPEEAVTLYVAVGKDIEEVHRSYRALAKRYFQRMKADINAFINIAYQPFVAEHLLTDKLSPSGGQNFQDWKASELNLARKKNDKNVFFIVN